MCETTPPGTSAPEARAPGPSPQAERSLSPIRCVRHPSSGSAPVRGRASPGGFAIRRSRRCGRAPSAERPPPPCVSPRRGASVSFRTRRRRSPWHSACRASRTRPRSKVPCRPERAGPAGTARPSSVPDRYRAFRSPNLPAFRRHPRQPGRLQPDAGVRPWPRMCLSARSRRVTKGWPSPSAIRRTRAVLPAPPRPRDGDDPGADGGA